MTSNSKFRSGLGSFAEQRSLPHPRVSRSGRSVALASDAENTRRKPSRNHQLTRMGGLREPSRHSVAERTQVGQPAPISFMLC